MHIYIYIYVCIHVRIYLCAYYVYISLSIYIYTYIYIYICIYGLTLPITKACTLMAARWRFSGQGRSRSDDSEHAWWFGSCAVVLLNATSGRRRSWTLIFGKCACCPGVIGACLARCRYRFVLPSLGIMQQLGWLRSSEPFSHPERMCIHIMYICMYVYIYIYIYIYTYIYIHVYMCIYIYIYIHVYTVIQRLICATGQAQLRPPMGWRQPRDVYITSITGNTLSMCVYTYIYIYIYIEREREIHGMT